MGLCIVAILGAAVRRDVAIEGRLARWREDRELHTEAAITAIAASPTAAETIAVRRPDTGDVARLEGHVRIVKLGVSRSGRASPSGRCASGLTRPCAPALILCGSRHNYGDRHHGGKGNRGA
jgi:hypothetical protein